jgi:TRAP-type C4-dicarboxylate transport system permease large subunit
LIIGFAQKTITLKDVPKMLETSAKVNGVIVPIIAMSLPLAQTLASLQVPQYFVHTMTSMTENRYLIMLIMVLIFMIAGCVMETTPNIVILAPILLPLALEIGMNEIHFCIIMITSLGIGFITPPLGLNLFVVSGVTGTPVLSISRYAVSFVFTMLLIVIILMLIPALSLWLI